jgi:hypothetical protein
MPHPATAPFRVKAHTGIIKLSNNLKNQRMDASVIFHP